ncbi:unnamed protein product [Gordionus sp. m RMFG-2023]|uniref:inactive rhomboid protein 2-like n=1 Tax=Gordionus sp. m RMFG-2023 TaxID=3053472 RepID=UPI0030DF9C95
MKDNNRISSKWDIVKRSLSQTTRDFLGISPSCDPIQDFSLRRLRLASRRCGHLKCPAKIDVNKFDQVDYPIIDHRTDEDGIKYSEKLRNINIEKQPTLSKSSLDYRENQKLDVIRKLSRRQSVAEIAWDGLKNLRERLRDDRKIDTSTTAKHPFIYRSFRNEPTNLVCRTRSFTPSSLNDFRKPSSDQTTPTTIVTPVDVADGLDMRRLEKGTLPADSSYISDEVFFDYSPTIGNLSQTRHPINDSTKKIVDIKAQIYKRALGSITFSEPPERYKHYEPYHPRHIAEGDKITYSKPKPEHLAFSGMKRIGKDVIHKVMSKSSELNKRYIGQGMLMDLINDSGYNATKIWEDPNLVESIKRLEDYRPFFTYWITTIQIIVTIAALIIYGIGPWGFGLRQHEKILLKTSLSLEKAGFLEPENFWVGPTPFSLIHLGAKYAPCMRKDPVVWKEIELRHASENKTACCVRRDGSGCVQSARADCLDVQFFDWIKYSSSVGTVCGQDPNYCDNPKSTHLRPWPNDLTLWPVCKSKSKNEHVMTSKKEDNSRYGLENDETSYLLPPHMSCDIIGKPCCIGIRGVCIVTTQSYCSFVRGHFHGEANLCSQVDCLADVCGMLPFSTTLPTPQSKKHGVLQYRQQMVFKIVKIPDQIYRLWISLFLHAGLLHLCITVIFQLTLMRDLEKLCGPLRLGVLYFVSGMGGNLGSAIFLPDRADAGPSGSQFGVLACLLVELFQAWQILKSPSLALIKMLFLYTLLILLGFLPWIDNYSHVFGFVFGFLMSFCLMPYLTFGHFDKRRKLVTLILSAIGVVCLYTGLFIVFYGYPEASYSCKNCKYFDCIPLEPNFCNNHEILINL